MNKNIIIIPNAPHHYDEIVKIYNQCFLPMFRFITKDEQLQHSFTDDFALISRTSKGNEFVAVKDDKVQGYLLLKYNNIRNVEPQYKMTPKQLSKKYGAIAIFKASVLSNLVNHKPNEDEIYIDSVCVAEGARGMGIGTMLMNFAKDFAREKGYRKISLRVMKENTKAKALYERLGFKVESFEPAKRLKRTTGYTGGYYMVMDI